MVYWIVCVICDWPEYLLYNLTTCKSIYMFDNQVYRNISICDYFTNSTPRHIISLFVSFTRFKMAGIKSLICVEKQNMLYKRCFLYCYPQCCSQIDFRKKRALWRTSFSALWRHFFQFELSRKTCKLVRNPCLVSARIKVITKASNRFGFVWF